MRSSSHIIVLIGKEEHLGTPFFSGTFKPIMGNRKYRILCLNRRFRKAWAWKGWYEHVRV